MATVQPFGERRADLRAAVMTANLLSAWSSKEASDSDFRELVLRLDGYMRHESETGEVADLAALEAMKRSV